MQYYIMKRTITYEKQRRKKALKNLGESDLQTLSEDPDMQPVTSHLAEYDVSFQKKLQHDFRKFKYAVIAT